MSQPAQAGDVMPDVAMETPDGGTVRPSDFRGRKLVLDFVKTQETKE